MSMHLSSRGRDEIDRGPSTCTSSCDENVGQADALHATLCTGLPAGPLDACMHVQQGRSRHPPIIQGMNKSNDSMNTTHWMHIIRQV
jgi:hypothetical protein